MGLLEGVLEDPTIHAQGARGCQTPEDLLRIKNRPPRDRGAAWKIEAAGSRRPWGYCATNESRWNVGASLAPNTPPSGMAPTPISTPT
jgi:hypothetical protein